ncbi:unnamed protein product [Closterium sp. NIES-54]
MDRHVFALDFDGVLCDSCGESSLSAVKAAKVRWPSLFADVSADVEETILKQMREVRRGEARNFHAFLPGVALITSLTLLSTIAPLTPLASLSTIAPLTPLASLSTIAPLTPLASLSTIAPLTPLASLSTIAPLTPLASLSTIAPLTPLASLSTIAPLTPLASLSTIAPLTPLASLSTIAPLTPLASLSTIAPLSPLASLSTIAPLTPLASLSTIAPLTPLASLSTIAPLTPLASLSSIAPLTPLASLSTIAPLTPLASLSTIAPLTPLASLSSAGEIKPAVMVEWGEEGRREQLVELFGAVRDEWMRDDLPGWIAANGMYAGVPQALQKAESPLYIVTTKQTRFALALLRELAGVDFPEDKVFGLGTGPKVQTLQHLQSLPQHEGCSFHFVEDRLATLRNVISTPQLDGWHLYLGTWGYNTEQERREAAQIPRIQIVDLPDFCSSLK